MLYSYGSSVSCEIKYDIKICRSALLHHAAANDIKSVNLHFIYISLSDSSENSVKSTAPLPS